MAGHALVGEGTPHRESDEGGEPQVTYGNGFGLCSCGARSLILDSAVARKRWHAEHKAEAWAAATLKVGYLLTSAMSGEDMGSFGCLDEANEFLVRGGVSGVEWAESDDGESWRGWHKGEKAYIVRRKTTEG